MIILVLIMELKKIMFYFIFKAKFTKVFRVKGNIIPKIYCLVGKHLFTNVGALHCGRYSSPKLVNKTVDYLVLSTVTMLC